MNDLIKYFGHPVFIKLASVLAGIIIILIIAGMIKKIISRQIKENNSRYKVRKFISYLAYFIIFLLVMGVYSNQLTGLTVFLGVAGAGIAFALQEVIASVGGFIVINFSHFYKVGDRVMLGGIKGDVVDIGVLRTSMMQIGDWVNGDLYNGKMVRVANSFVFKEPVYNYSGDFPFLWDELTIPLKVESDYEYACEIFMEILNEVQGAYAKEAEKYWARMTDKLMIENAQVAPMVTMSFNENWITLTLRFVVDFKKRRGTQHLIYGKILEAIKNSNGRLIIGATTMEITAFPEK